MRVLILSEMILRNQKDEDSRFIPPHDVQLDLASLNDAKQFVSSVFDYDVSIVHIQEPPTYSGGYHENIPKLTNDSIVALKNGRTIICLPDSKNFRPYYNRHYGPPIYKWLEHLGVELQENFGEDIRPSGAGLAEVIQEYLRNAPRYYQIVKKPQVEPKRRLAVVGETDIVVGSEHEAADGVLVVLPPPLLETEYYQPSTLSLVRVARRYSERAQRRIPISDSPSWVDKYLVPQAKEINEQLSDLSSKKAHYDLLAYALYGTGKDLEKSVQVLLEQLGLEVTPQPQGANIDLKATHKKAGLGFAVEVTGTKGTIQKDSSKVPQAWEYISQRSGTPEQEFRLIVIANTESHLDPKDRKRESFSANVAKLLGDNGVLLMTTVQLYELWKSVHEGKEIAEEIVQQLHTKQGKYIG